MALRGIPVSAATLRSRIGSGPHHRCGRVVSKLDALKIAKSTGDLPQHVNFAIRSKVLRGFLEKNRIDFTASRDTAKLENTEIASQGAAVTVRVRSLRQAVPVTPVRDSLENAVVR